MPQWTTSASELTHVERQVPRALSEASADPADQAVEASSSPPDWEGVHHRRVEFSKGLGLHCALMEYIGMARYASMDKKPAPADRRGRLDARLTHVERRILRALLGDDLGPEGRTVEAVVERTGIDEATVRTALVKLEAEGAIDSRMDLELGLEHWFALTEAAARLDQLG